MLKSLFWIYVFECALVYLKCLTVDFTIPEGCTNLVSSLEGVRMTTEGIFIIEEPGKTDSAVRLYSCVTCVISHHIPASNCSIYYISVVDPDLNPHL